MNHIVRPTLALAVLTLLGIARTAYAQSYTFFPNDATIDYTISGTGIVGYANDSDFFVDPRRNSTSPTVNVVDGGNIDYDLSVYNSSAISISGGSIRYNLETYDNSTLNIRGGSIGSYVEAFNNSTINMSSGSIGSFLAVSNSSTANVSGGNIDGGLFTYDNSTLNLAGGSIGDTLNSLGGMVNISGGSIHRYLRAIGSSTINFSGGSIGSYLEAYNSSTINISGGSIGGYLRAYKSSTVNLSGGSIDSDLYALGSTFNFFGSGLKTQLIDPNYFDVFSHYLLSGTLQDGTVLNDKNLFVENGTGASFYLFDIAAVPESGSIALLVGMASVGIAARRKRL